MAWIAEFQTLVTYTIIDQYPQNTSALVATPSAKARQASVESLRLEQYFESKPSNTISSIALGEDELGQHVLVSVQ